MIRLTKKLSVAATLLVAGALCIELAGAQQSADPPATQSAPAEPDAQTAILRGVGQAPQTAVRAGVGAGVMGIFVAPSTQPAGVGPMSISGKLVRSDNAHVLILETRATGSALYSRAIIQIDPQTVLNVEGAPPTLDDIPEGTSLIADLNVTKDGDYKVRRVSDPAHYNLLN